MPLGPCSFKTFTLNFLIHSSLHGVKNFANLNHSKLSRQNSDGNQKNKPCEQVIDCGDIVWSLAFGSSVPEKRSRCVNIEWHRFRFGQDQLLLATGLANGRIKIWDAYTGKEGHFDRAHGSCFPSKMTMRLVLFRCCHGTASTSLTPT